MSCRCEDADGLFILLWVWTHTCEGEGIGAILATVVVDLRAWCELDIQIVDILRDKADLQLKREAEAEIVREGNKLVVRSFYPMNLMQKLSLQKEYVEEWRQLVESIMIDWNYDGAVMQPSVTDVPGKKEMVAGVYDIPENAGTIKIKITELASVCIRFAGIDAIGIIKPQL